MRGDRRRRMPEAFPLIRRSSRFCGSLLSPSFNRFGHARRLAWSKDRRSSDRTGQSILLCHDGCRVPWSMRLGLVLRIYHLAQWLRSPCPLQTSGMSTNWDKMLGPDFERQVRDRMREWSIPGAAVTLVPDDPAISPLYTIVNDDTQTTGPAVTAKVNQSETKRQSAEVLRLVSPSRAVRSSSLR